MALSEALKRVTIPRAPQTKLIGKAFDQRNTSPIDVPKEGTILRDKSSFAKTKRYSLILPEDLYSEVQAYASKKHVTVLELLKRFIKLGLIIANAERDGDVSVVIREKRSDGGIKEREIILV